MVLEGSSGDVALDRAAWGALTGSNYRRCPEISDGPYLELRAWFLYNMEPQRVGWRSEPVGQRGWLFNFRLAEKRV